MAAGVELKLKSVNPNQIFVNNFKIWQTVQPINLTANTTTLFYFNEQFNNERSVYLFLSGVVNQNVTIELLRSMANFGFDEEMAVPIPGASLVMTASAPIITTIDFNISNYGANQLWMKITTPVGLAGSRITNCGLIIKP